jgi:hypothetical protein
LKHALSTLRSQTPDGGDLAHANPEISAFVTTIARLRHPPLSASTGDSMTPDTPEPGKHARRGKPPTGRGQDPKAPRILVSVEDLEDPAEWDVIVVENDEVDDETARAIARQRHAPRNLSLPSLDERDVQAALETDRGEAEDAEGIGVDAFALPDAKVRERRPVLPPIEDDGFPDPPEPQPEVVETEEEAEATRQEDAPAAEEAAPAPWTPADLEPMAPGPEQHRPTTEELDADLHDEPPLAGEPEGEVPVPEPAAPPRLRDDPTDDFYAIGDVPEVAASEDPTVAEGAESTDAEADADEATTKTDSDSKGDDETTHAVEERVVDDERELLDDPEDDFYALGEHAARLDADVTDDEDEDHGPHSGPVPVAPKVLHDLPDHAERLSALLWGQRPDGDGPDPDAPRELAFGPSSSSDDVFVDEVTYDSSFPLGPDDVVAKGNRPPVPIDTLDFASVFGPVEGALEVPDLTQEPQHARHHADFAAYYLDDTALGTVEEDEPEEADLGPWTVAPARGGRRRRELLVLGVAAGAMLAIGLGTQVFGRANHHLNTADTTTSTIGQRLKVGDTPSTILSPTSSAPIVGGTDGGSGSSTKRRTTTTVSRTTKTTVRTSTSAPAATTTTAAPVTTTTAPPTTTTTLDAGTTGGPSG